MIDKAEIMKSLGWLALVACFLVPPCVASAADTAAGEKKITENSQFMYDAFASSVVKVTGPKGAGAGALIHENCLILTSAQIVGEDEEIHVTFKPDKPEQATPSRARLTAIDSDAGLALVRASSCPNGIRPIAPDAPQDVRVGDVVHIIHPQGLNWRTTRASVSDIQPGLALSGGEKGRHYPGVFTMQTMRIFIATGSPVFTDTGKLAGLMIKGGNPRMAVDSRTILRFLDAVSAKK